MKKFTSLILCILLVLTIFSGCSNNEEKINFIYPFGGKINSYDPQVASTADEFMLIENTFEGLVRVNDDGTVQKGVAESWSIDDDSLTYTFKLRKGVKWRINDAIIERMGEDFDPDITAHDFVFALRRGAQPETQAPLFSTIACIKNASAINKGEMSSEYLGVVAKDDYTLVITLETPNEEFMSTLATAIAMPCNQQFFEGTNGRYGLPAKYTLFNGQFYLRQVLESSYLLRNNEAYTGEHKSIARELTLKIVDDNSKADILERLESGYYDAAFINGSDSKKIKDSSGVSYTPYIDTTWAFVFNCNNEYFQYDELRNAFCKGFTRIEQFEEEYFSPATSFAPPSCKVGASNIDSITKTTLTQDSKKSVELWNDKIKTLKQKPIVITVLTGESTETIVKKTSQGIQSGIGAISAYDDGDAMQFTLKVETLTDSELKSRVASGDFDLAFYPFKSEAPSAVSFYSSFNNSNIPDFDNEALTTYITNAQQASDIGTITDNVNNCEQNIIDSHCVCPMIFESSYYASAKGVKNIQFHAGSGRVSFVNATRED